MSLAPSQHQVPSPSDDELAHWRAVPLGRLVDHVRDELHPRVRDALPRLETLARKVFALHGAQAPEELSGLLELVVRLRDRLELHMRLEEEVVLPLLWAEARSPLEEAVAQMRREHDAVRAVLVRMHQLTNGFRLPLGATGSWRQLWVELEALAHQLTSGLRLEDEVLFARALQR